MDKLGWQADIDRSNRYLDTLHPNEVHGLEGDCPNPKCDYHLTSQDEQEVQQDHGWFVCPKCGMSSNLWEETQVGGYTHAQGITPTQMGVIGEQVVNNMGSIPGVGQILKHYGADLYNNPIDFQIGPYGVEVKTNHSESTPRFKLTGGAMGGSDNQRTRAEAIGEMVAFCDQNGLIPAMIGVRLNFYTDNADIFFRQGLADTYIGSANLKHVATVNFTNLNPFKDPSKVPSPQDLPEDDIPF